MKIIYCLFLLFFSFTAHPKTSKKEEIKACSKYVNLQRDRWYIQRNVPTLDQGPVGLCYAHAAVNLLDFWRDIHGLKLTKNIALSNPHYAALLYKMENAKAEKGILDSGNAVATLKAVKKHGMCRDDVIDLAMDKFSKEKRISTRDFYAVTQWFLEFYNDSIRVEIERAPNKAEKLKEIFSRYTDRKDVKEIFQNGDFVKIYEVFEPYLLKKNYRGFFQDVFKECFNRESIYLGTLKIPDIKKVDKRSNFASKIITNLDQKNPLGISYSHQILKGGKKYSKIRYLLYDTDHASILIGKRVREGKCQFLLKNTWGTYCKYAWECQKTPDGMEVGAWIDADYLIPAIKSVFYFENAK